MDTELRVLPSMICKKKLSVRGIKFNDEAMMCAFKKSVGTCKVVQNQFRILLILY
jgi:hypothetical protein